MRKAAIPLLIAPMLLTAQSGYSNHKLTKADIDRWMMQLSNW